MAGMAWGGLERKERDEIFFGRGQETMMRLVSRSRRVTLPLHLLTPEHIWNRLCIWCVLVVAYILFHLVSVTVRKRGVTVLICRPTGHQRTGPHSRPLLHQQLF